ncbi:MAG: hypothetical protein IPN13_15225 [Bacteroidetes bacterium]|nr:hypothetical protein [Bacteroidota bacterium]
MNFSGPGNDEVTAVCQDTGNLFVAGTFEQLLTLKSTVSITISVTSAGGKDIFIIKK